MKNQIILTSGARKLCLMTFILLCSVFASKNAFSLKWEHKDMTVTYLPNENAIDIKFLFYQFPTESDNVHSYMMVFDILYTLDNSEYIPLIKGLSVRQGLKDKKFIHIVSNKYPDAIRFVGSKLIDGEPKDRWYIMKESQYKDGEVTKKVMTATANLKWTLPKHLSKKTIKSIQIVGIWAIDNSMSINIVDTYPNPYCKSTSPKATPSILSKDKKVTVNADAITITGVNPGENIKVYNTKGIEVKSVVVKGDVVNIKLSKNHNYLVKIGKRSVQVSL